MLRELSSGCFGVKVDGHVRNKPNRAMTLTDATATWRPVELRPMHMVLEARTEEPAALAPDAGAALTAHLTLLLRHPPLKLAAKRPSPGSERLRRYTPSWLR